MLAKRREVKYARQLAEVIDRALERLVRIYVALPNRVRVSLNY
jgi:hypothetical protein